MKLPNFNAMSDEEFDSWLRRALIQCVEYTRAEMEASQDSQNEPGLSPEIRQKLLEQVIELEKKKNGGQ